jgi:hypothetical protein
VAGVGPPSFPSVLPLAGSGTPPASQAWSPEDQAPVSARSHSGDSAVAPAPKGTKVRPQRGRADLTKGAPSGMYSYASRSPTLNSAPTAGHQNGSGRSAYVEDNRS